MPASRIPLIYGTSRSIGLPGFGVIPDLDSAQKVIDLFAGHGYTRYDTARRYSGGTAEEALSKLDLHGGLVDTKCFPAQPGDHSPEKLREAVETSARTLAPHKINVFYLHSPDRSVKFEDTCRAINELHKEGYFTEFGLSNFYSWEVSEIYTICKLNGWLVPTVYQGVYNVIERTIEPELLPCLRAHGMRIHVYSPLAGGLLTGKFHSVDQMRGEDAKGSRWDSSSGNPFVAKLQERYAPLVPIFAELQGVLEKHNITLTEAALRWLQHHSQLTPEDRVIIGASKLIQLEQSMGASEKGPLPDEVVKLLEDAHKSVDSRVAHYAAWA
ncbi:Aldo/keto reductase [Schizophyllum commune H4-8]|uniref:NADP-dependent oxidoreductase domain-containing protein n=1 Tax=Schizophyllum commune (strain H4-8 / FGSC 9210) TaxID=578458 RepID=D8Q3W0_SCHCM|nr:Aldo/keto reductase [Schizophyllum commune H4-8]KAI5892868.1 Aldo/keto reductase [Schizophyllum commune H4-8]